MYIAVNPVGSKFAKALQGALSEKVHDKIYRVSPERAAQKLQRRPRSIIFHVTPRTLDKVAQFHAFARDGVSHPPFTTSPDEVRNLDARTVFARTLVNSTNGRGIMEFDIADDMVVPRAPLYTAYIPKKAEYRVHVFKGQVIDVQQKKKRKGFEDERNTRVRNVANGYVYCRDGIEPPAGINDLAISAVVACGYDYGAVDIIYNEKRNQCYVLEVNSRPGLLGTTLQRYCEALINSYNLRRK